MGPFSPRDLNQENPKYSLRTVYSRYATVYAKNLSLLPRNIPSRTRRRTDNWASEDLQRPLRTPPRTSLDLEGPPKNSNFQGPLQGSQKPAQPCSTRCSPWWRACGSTPAATSPPTPPSAASPTSASSSAAAGRPTRTTWTIQKSSKKKILNNPRAANLPRRG